MTLSDALILSCLFIFNISKLTHFKVFLGNNLVNVTSDLYECNWIVLSSLLSQANHPDVAECAVVGFPHEIKGEGEIYRIKQFIFKCNKLYIESIKIDKK